MDVRGWCVVGANDCVVQKYGKVGKGGEVGKLCLGHQEGNKYILLSPLDILGDQHWGLRLGEMGLEVEVVCICGC